MTGLQVTAAHGCRHLVSRLWHHWLLRRRTRGMERIVGLPVRGLASDLQIRSNRRTVHNRPGVAACWAGIPGLSPRVGSWLWPWQQVWQQSGAWLRICPGTDVARASLGKRAVVDLGHGSVALLPWPPPGGLDLEREA